MKLPPNAKILVVPDSFKGTLDAPLVAEAIKRGFLRNIPDATIECFPMADGGEGSSTIVGEILGAERITIDAIGPEGAPVSAFYYVSKSGQCAYIELAAASGLPLSKSPQDTAERATTYGTGQLLRHAITRGAREITLFLGGSATSDAGVGLAKAVGYEFYDESGRKLSDPEQCIAARTTYPGEQLLRIASIRAGSAAKFLEGVKVTAVADVKNPLFGPRGAAAIYGPQKGLSTEGVRFVDEGMQRVAQVVVKDLNCDFCETPGAGAAGGAGYGVLSFFGGAVRPGAQFFLDLIDFNERTKGASLIITGEGKVDLQSVEGKLLCELLERTRAISKPLLSLSGVVDLAPEYFSKYPHFLAFGLGRTDAVTNTERALELLSAQVAALLC